MDTEWFRQYLAKKRQRYAHKLFLLAAIADYNTIMERLGDAGGCDPRTVRMAERLYSFLRKRRRNGDEQS